MQHALTKNPIAQTLLMGVLIDIELTGHAIRNGGDVDTDVLIYGPRWSVSRWRFCEVSRAEQARFRRIGDRIEAAGLIERVAALGGRTTHVQPTAAGLLEAIKLAGDRCNVGDVQACLDAAEWAEIEL